MNIEDFFVLADGFGFDGLDFNDIANNLDRERLVSFLRTMVRTMDVLGLPRMSLTDSSMVIPSVTFLSILRMISPDLTPAFLAGVSSIGAMIPRPRK